MMQEVSFSLSETLHMVALLPCLFAIILLFTLNRFSATIIVPCLFFLSLSGTFLLGLWPSLFPSQAQPMPALIWLESLQPAVCFLLIVQLWRQRVPSWAYWLILALPIVGGSSLVLASYQLDDICLLGDYCVEAYELRTLYQFFATAFIFLFLIVHLSRIPLRSETKSRYESHRYWLIIALVLAYASLMLVDLLSLKNRIDAVEYERIHVVMRVCFMYLVLTSLFRVFDKEADYTNMSASVPKPIDEAVVARIESAMMQDKLYREMSCNREQFAKKLELPEHVISRTINQAMGKNFNEYINSYRVQEAQTRLASEETSITAIAFEVGFSSTASFNRVFKAMVGRSPTEYRQSNS
jgi:AraC-like DNA-binding protein